ncbi:hypothetical protein [Halorubrum sp. SS7]|uniref:DUF7344 domain-containing protein n=1 Tax=Halorubrum sp. SS7 TaxID=2518119 RepID=UPI0018EE7A52|nr:hypothetical protein [Halorubrum sp. SS7]
MSHSPPLDEMCELYEMLRRQRRCYVLLVVGANTTPPYPVRPVARRVTALLDAVPLSAATGDRYQNVYVSLIQTHLPRLAEADLITYNPDRKLIAPGPELPTALLVLRAAWAAYEPSHAAEWPLGEIDATIRSEP